MPPIGGNIDLLRIIDRDGCRVPAQIPQLPKGAQEKPIVPIHHLHCMFNGVLFAHARMLESSIGAEMASSQAVAPSTSYFRNILFTSQVESS
jgi:hypothetical protein